MTPTRPPQYGEPAPWFVARTAVNPTFHFDTVGGRYVVLCFFGSAADPRSARVLAAFLRAGGTFDGNRAIFLGVSIDPADEAQARVPAATGGVITFWDFDRAVSRMFGADSDAGYRPHTVLLDERLRVVGKWGFGDDPDAHAAAVLQALAELPVIGPPVPAVVQAPILVVPRVFEPDLCRALIRYYEERGGQESGFMREVDGKTVGVYDPAHKRRKDEEIADESLRQACMHRIHDRLIPELLKAFQFRATRMERYIVACYDADSGGHFRPHRDNTTKGTAHRRFAVSLILNTGEFDGGFVRFPEYGPHLYTAPAGGAVVFSCSLLHEATPVTRGKRYVFLPFLYDEAGAKIREENLPYVGGFQDRPPG